MLFLFISNTFIKSLLITIEVTDLGFITLVRYYFHFSSKVIFCLMLFICYGIGPLLFTFSSLFLFLTFFFFLPVFATFLLYPSFSLLGSMQSSDGCPECKVELLLFQCDTLLKCLELYFFCLLCTFTCNQLGLQFLFFNMLVSIELGYQQIVLTTLLNMFSR